MARRRKRYRPLPMRNPRADKLLAWGTSVALHAGIGLLAAFVILAAGNGGTSAEGKVIIVPQSFEDPSYSAHAGEGVLGDPVRVSTHDRLTELNQSEGWPGGSGANVASLLRGGGGGLEAAGIFRGSGASIVPGRSENPVAAYGTPGGGGTGPRSSLYKTSGNATRIVYILDHSGSMLDNFEFLKGEATRSVNNLVPLQYFAVLLVSDKVTTVGSGGGGRLQQALPEAKKQFADLIKREVAEGANDNLLGPFEEAFRRAFEMDPELIYFLTDGRFGDGLVTKVKEMNKEGRVHINTIAFVTEEPAYKGQLQELARENGGKYQFVPQGEVEIGKP